MNYNPIYLCFCKANNHDPAQRIPSGKFAQWVMEQKRIYGKTHGIIGDDWTSRQIEKFHQWLKNRYLGGADDAPRT